jgi:hypothetical protein
MISPITMAPTTLPMVISNEASPRTAEVVVGLVGDVAVG